jgi:hypothetical protein
LELIVRDSCGASLDRSQIFKRFLSDPGSI